MLSAKTTPIGLGGEASAQCSTCLAAANEWFALRKSARSIHRATGYGKSKSLSPFRLSGFLVDLQSLTCMSVLILSVAMHLSNLRMEETGEMSECAAA